MIFMHYNYRLLNYEQTIAVVKQFYNVEISDVFSQILVCV